MINKKDIVGSLLSERSNFIIIGLTGRTGSGCTTTASILEDDKADYPHEKDITLEGESFYQGLDKRRYETILGFATKNYVPFTPIKVSDLITVYLLSLSQKNLTNYIVSVSSRENKLKKTAIKHIFSSYRYRQTIKSKELIKKLLSHDTKLEFTDDESHRFFLYMSLVRNFTAYLKKVLNELEPQLYIRLYQHAGNSIRKTGKVEIDPANNSKLESSIYHLPETINRVVKAIRKIKNQSNEPCYIVIDAIRNPYEAKFFKDRYAAFYLVSINAPNEDRKSYLQQVHKFTVDQFDDLEKRESGKSDEFIGQNVSKCIEISDIHIFNPRKEADNHNVLKAQLAWYISLMQHPGLITPTALERVMQMAYTAKMNSGCISRQVGAVITDQDYSIKAIGWNDVPKGQVPCNLRTIDGLMGSFDQEVYSHYERHNEKFRNIAIVEVDKLSPIKENTGRHLAYCFKTLQNKLDDEKNQVHTRSLHAEENAFLQLAKYGGMGITGGKLFTTASPCELCSKKAYQLGIKDIIFIDPYPGIAIDHILDIGTQKPNLIQFKGAVGKGYHQLYEPLMPYKDELATLADTYR